MEYLWIAAGVFVLFLVHKLILAPMRHLLVNVVVGLIVLYGVNHFGYLFGFQHVPITIGTGLIIGLFGLPGVVLVTLYYTIFLTYAKRGYREIEKMGRPCLYGCLGCISPFGLRQQRVYEN